MKIFGIGYHRTGTTSLHACFEILGLKSIHYYMEQAYDDIAHVSIDKINYDIFDRYECFADFPTPYLYRELDRRFPDSRFILTIRNPRSWIESLARHFSSSQGVWGPWGDACHRRVYGRDGVGFNPEIQLKSYDKHNREVLDYFSGRPNELFVLDWPKLTGWDELCRFLGQEKPTESIPWRNRSV